MTITNILTLPAVIGLTGNEQFPLVQASGTGSFTDKRASIAQLSAFFSGTGPVFANLVYAGPTSGGAALPTFRALVNADLSAGIILYANIQNESASTFLGNPTGAPAAPSEITLGATLAFSGSALQTLAHTGDVTSPANSLALTIAANAVTTAKIANSAITYAKIQNESATTLLGNPTGAPAAPSEITLTAALAFAGTTLDVANNGITNAKLRLGTGLSVIGVTGSSTANVADIVGTAAQVLRVNDAGTSLAFGQVDLAQSAAVTGILPVANGGTGTSTAFSSGSVIFAGASGVYSQDNANFFWDSGNHRLGIGTAAPAFPLDISFAGADQARFRSTGANRAEIIIDNAAGGNQSVVAYLDAGTVKWQVGKQTDNSFIMFDAANAGNFLTVSTAGNVTLGETGKTVTVALAGLTLTGLTQGSILFGGASAAVSQDNAKFFWDDTHFALGITTATPASIGSGTGVAIGGPQKINVNPTGNAQATSSTLVVQVNDNAAANTNGGLGIEFAGVFGITSSHGDGSTPNKVALYASAITSGTTPGNLWAINTVTTINSTAGLTAVQGYELDFNNQTSTARNYSNLGTPGYGLSVTGVSTAVNTSAIFIGGNPGSPQWTSGMVFNQFRSANAAQFGIDFGFDVNNTVSKNWINVPNNQSITFGGGNISQSTVSGTTPTIGALSGLGASGTASVAGGPNAGTITLSPAGAGPTFTGLFTLTWIAWPTTGASIALLAFDGTGTWVSNPTFKATFQSTTQVTIQWSNGSTALTAGSTYKIMYVVIGT